MQAELEETLLLQGEWSYRNTDSMQRRGVLVRTEIPEWIRSQIPAMSSGRRFLEDLKVGGRDGTGRKTEIPWSRVYSLRRSPSATQGWYVAYLFSASGDRVYLSLNQGTTRWEAGTFKPRPEQELTARVAWARKILGISKRDDLGFDILLQARRTNLGHQYELGNVAAFVYELKSIPGDEQLTADLGTMVAWLSAIYEAEETAVDIPGETPVEVSDALLAISQVSNGGRRNGQGFRISTAEKLAIERHAVEVVTTYYRHLGYRVRDVGLTKSFDLEAEMGDQRLSIEVKGTTSSGSEIILTSGEVRYHRECFPANSLAVVHSIHLNRTLEVPTASGGTLHIVSPWSINEQDLQPVGYRYVTGVG